MKNFFNCNSKEMPYPVPDAKQYITRRIPETELNKIQEMRAKAEQAEKKSSLPLVLQIVYWVAALGFVICLCGLLENIGEVSFAEMYANAAGVFYAGAVCFVVFAALFVYKLILRKKVVQSSAFAQMEADAAKVLAVSKEAMGIPEDARETDIFIRLYKITRRGKERNANLFAEYVNQKFYVYQREDVLCFATLEYEVSVPVRSFFAYQKKQKSANFSGWNKDVPMNSPTYKPYKVRANQYGMLFVKPYYGMQFKGAEGEYEILIPPYELETMRSLVELPVL